MTTDKTAPPATDGISITPSFASALFQNIQGTVNQLSQNLIFWKLPDSLKQKLIADGLATTSGLNNGVTISTENKDGGSITGGQVAGMVNLPSTKYSINYGGKSQVLGYAVPLGYNFSTPYGSNQTALQANYNVMEQKNIGNNLDLVGYIDPNALSSYTKMNAPAPTIKTLSGENLTGNMYFVPASSVNYQNVMDHLTGGGGLDGWIDAATRGAAFLAAVYGGANALSSVYGPAASSAAGSAGAVGSAAGSAASAAAPAALDEASAAAAAEFGGTAGAGTGAAAAVSPAATTGGSFVGSSGFLGSTGTSFGDALLNGAVKGGLTSGLTGGDPIKGAAAGAVNGAVGASSVGNSISQGLGVTDASTKAAINSGLSSAAGAGAGSLAGGASFGDALQTAATFGAVSGIGSYAASSAKTDFGASGSTAGAIGGATSGFAGALLTGKDILASTLTGAASGAAGGLASDMGASKEVADAAGSLTSAAIGSVTSSNPPAKQPFQTQPASKDFVLGLSFGSSLMPPKFTPAPRRDMGWGDSETDWGNRLSTKSQVSGG